jgi:Recombinase
MALPIILKNNNLLRCRHGFLNAPPNRSRIRDTGEAMSNIERSRQVVQGQFGPDDFQQKLSEGWKPIAIEWEREVATQSETVTAPAPEVPYGLRVSGDCAHLESDPSEREVLFQIMELTIQDGPYSGIAAELNRRGYRTRNGQPWTPISVFQMLPRLIEAGPGILNSDEWRQRRTKIRKVANP